MVEKYLLFSLDDEKAKKLGDVISNSTCRKVVNFLAEKEASETEIAKELDLPLNTVEYNLNKLLEAGIIEKTKNFLWSEKGKRIEKYKVANKLIVISPKKTNVYSKLKSIVPIVLISAILTGFVAWYSKSALLQNTAERTSEIMSEEFATKAGSVASETVASFSFNPWFWFGIGGLIVIIAFLIWNWKRL